MNPDRSVGTPIDELRSETAPKEVSPKTNCEGRVVYAESPMPLSEDIRPVSVDNLWLFLRMTGNSKQKSLKLALRGIAPLAAHS